MLHPHLFSLLLLRRTRIKGEEIAHFVCFGGSRFAPRFTPLGTLETVGGAHSNDINRRILCFGHSCFGFEICSPCGDSHKYNQIGDLSIYGIGFRISDLGFGYKVCSAS